MPLHGPWIGSHTGGGGGSPFDPASLAIFAAMTTPPSGARKAVVDTLVRALKTAGVWSKLDLLYLTAAADAQAARLNWIAPTGGYTLSPINSPAFAADRGYTGDGVSSYLDTGWDNAAIPSKKLTQDNNSQFVWVRSAGAGVGTYAGNGRMLVGRTATVASYRNFTSANVNGATTAANHSGKLFGTTRTGPTSFDVYLGGVFVETLAGVSNAGSNAFALLSRAGTASFSDAQIAAYMHGSDPSPGEIAAGQTAVAAYMTSIGA